jgi:hypothetical protein
MKFVTVEFEVYVREGLARTPHTLAISMTAGDGEGQAEVLERLRRAIERVCETVDIGDCE